MRPHSAIASIRRREVDDRFLDPRRLDVVERERTNALPWRGQFTPGLPAVLLESLSPSGTVLDPFVGSGTTLGESARLGLSAVGAEINPAALSLAKVYETFALTAEDRFLATCEVSARAASFGADRAAKKIPLEALGDLIWNAPDEPTSDLLVATLMLAVGNARETTSVKIARAARQVCGLVLALPRKAGAVRVLGADARTLPLQDQSVGMVLTSPPYINVFNYHQNYRPVMEFLGWDILPAARSEIGSNRKHRANRFLTVVQYCMDMAATLKEVARVAQVGAPIVFVVGRESNVREVPFPNGEILSALAEMNRSLEFERWQERNFVNRYGKTIKEDVLTFRVNSFQSMDYTELESDAKELGIVLLEEAIDKAPSAEVAEEVVRAIAGAGAVLGSPSLVLSRETAREPVGAAR